MNKVAHPPIFFFETSILPGICLLEPETKTNRNVLLFIKYSHATDDSLDILALFLVARRTDKSVFCFCFLYKTVLGPDISSGGAIFSYFSRS